MTKPTNKNKKTAEQANQQRTKNKQAHTSKDTHITQNRKQKTIQKNKKQIANPPINQQTKTKQARNKTSKQRWKPHAVSHRKIQNSTRSKLLCHCQIVPWHVPGIQCVCRGYCFIAGNVRAFSYLLPRRWQRSWRRTTPCLPRAAVLGWPEAYSSA